MKILGILWGRQSRCCVVQILFATVCYDLTCVRYDIIVHALDKLGEGFSTIGIVRPGIYDAMR